MENKNNSYNNDDRSQLPELTKVFETNVFPIALAEGHFKKINNDTWLKGPDQIIKVFFYDNKWQYQNLKNTDDRGSLIEFIANRLRQEHPVVNKDPADLLRAGQLARQYHAELIKTVKREFKLQQPASAQKRRLRH